MLSKILWSKILRETGWLRARSPAGMQVSYVPVAVAPTLNREAGEAAVAGRAARAWPLLWRAPDPAPTPASDPVPRPVPVQGMEAFSFLHVRAVQCLPEGFVQKPRGADSILRWTPWPPKCCKQLFSFRLRARLDVCMPSTFFGQRGIPPRFWIWRSAF